LRALLIRPDKIESHFHMEQSTERLGDLHQPLGLLYLATVLKKAGVEVFISDEIVGDDSLKSFEEFNPDIIGITVTTPLFERACDLVGEFRKRGGKVILGGPHISSVPEESIEKSGADAVIVGEGEDTIKELCREKEWKNVAGIIYRENGRLKRTEPRELIADLDTIPIPDRGFLDLSKYRNDVEFGFPIAGKDVLMRVFTSRGCPYRCTFCSTFNIFGRKVRFRSADNILEEIHYLNGKYNTRHFMFMDDTFTLKEDIVRELCSKFLDEKLELRWACFARVGISKETLKAMKDAGCQLIGFGVESGSEKVLNNVKKKTTPQQIETTFSEARAAGIDAKAFFIVGLPGEEEEDFKESLDFARRINPPFLWLSMFYPLPGTEAYESVLKEGRLKDANRVSYFQSEDEELKRRHRTFLRKFYLRPGYLVNIFKNFSFRRILYFARMFKAYFHGVA